MSESDTNELFGIELDTDNYAEAAAEDTPTVSRTYQSEADFQAVKASYIAKQDYGNTYKDLLKALPELDDNGDGVVQACGAPNGQVKRRLGKKDGQLLGYAVGELYYDGEYKRIIELSENVERSYDIDAKTAASLQKWTKRCRKRQTGPAGSG